MVSIRPLRQSVRPSPVFLAIVAITAVGGVIAWLAGFDRTPLAYVGVFVFVVFGWLVSLCLHEFGHAYTAWRYGDHDDARSAGACDGTGMATLGHRASGPARHHRRTGGARRGDGPAAGQAIDVLSAHDRLAGRPLT